MNVARPLGAQNFFDLFDHLAITAQVKFLAIDRLKIVCKIGGDATDLAAPRAGGTRQCGDEGEVGMLF